MCLVGCGGMGERHVRGFGALREHGIEHVGLAAVCDLDEAAAVRIAGIAESTLGHRPKVYASVDEALNDDGIDAFDIVTDASSHHRVAVPILEAGRHLLCEKPLGITVQNCQVILDAAQRSGAVLGVAENYRRGPANRLARAVLDSGILGDIHLFVEFHVGGDDGIIITPWRHLKERGAIGLDMAVHYTDIVQYLLGPFETAFGAGLIAEPVRRRREAPEMDLASYHARHAGMPETVEATGEDSIIAMFQMQSGVMAQCVNIASGPEKLGSRTVYGRDGVMRIPRDRSGLAVEVTFRDGSIQGDDLAELIGFELDPLTQRLFQSTVYDRPFEWIDAAHVAVELADFGSAVIENRSPEVDGELGTAAVAAVLAVLESGVLGRAVTYDEVRSGAVHSYQDEIDLALGLEPVGGRS
ncbi:putative dehydrogenase [Ilumatobacter fluminis]|uniref:Putative dehydrogenase n=2 Tax=Ilumatobacter fluminis TaxID=467091 RepID=A0A4R7HXR1_9ACTN|nr:putative dehydrogenase [Ilumatobacter fluminis]